DRMLDALGEHRQPLLGDRCGGRRDQQGDVRPRGHLGPHPGMRMSFHPASVPHTAHRAHPACSGDGHCRRVPADIGLCPTRHPGPEGGSVPQTAPRPLGVAMIGYAFMGRAHSQAWRTVAAAFEVPAVARRVIVGRDETAVAEAAARLDWEQHATDWREVISREDIDIVDICTPGFLHAEIAIAALEAGKHVLCGKPLANDTAEAEAMVRAAEAATARGQVAALGFTYRRVPALALAKQFVEEGKLGTVRQAKVAYLQDWLVDAEAPMSWRLRKETAGSGALGDIASHAIDQVQHLTGQRTTAVRGRLATMVPQRPGEDGTEAVTVDDAAWATLELDGGAIASVEVSRMATGAKNRLTVELYG